jgi:hypothetical protein
MAESLLAVLAALINLVVMALFHNPQSVVLNGVAAGLCFIIAILRFRDRRGGS